MALRRKKRYENPVKCSMCKEVKAHHTVHGFMRYGGRTCCNDCYPGVRAEWESEQAREASYSMTEADYQTWYRL